MLDDVSVGPPAALGIGVGHVVGTFDGASSSSSSSLSSMTCAFFDAGHCWALLWMVYFFHVATAFAASLDGSRSFLGSLPGLWKAACGGFVRSTLKLFV